MRAITWIAAIFTTLTLIGCDQRPAEPVAGVVPNPANPTKVRIALNWVPEPEFGGIYAAQQRGDFKRENIDAEILPGGAGAPTWQLVGSGNVEFGIASADEVALARTRGADIVALFATYQTCPQAIMVHRERGLTKLEDALKSGTLAVEKGLAYATFLERKYGFEKVKLVPYDGGIASFLADKNFAQQCFIFSEPIAARRQGASPQVFLVADSGYNPYTAVLIARGDYVKQNKATVDRVLKALRSGWQAYVADPNPANAVMQPLNRTMDAQTFTEAADAQKLLVQPAGTPAEKIGTMTLDRWQQLITQLRDLKVLDKDIPPQDCFVQPTW